LEARRPRAERTARKGDQRIPTAGSAGPEALALVNPSVAQRVQTRRRIVVTVLGTLAVSGALAYELAGRRGQFGTALLTAPLWVLLLAALFHLTSLLTRSEAWKICVHAAGGSVSRRVLFRAAGFGSLASVLSAQLGVAARISALRRSAPQTAPRIPALIAAEVPILAVEAMLAALFMFTLVGPLDLPAWVPVIVIAAMLALVVAIANLARRRRSGLWQGLAAMRELRGRGRLITFVVLGVIAQIARNWLILHAVGVNASVFDAIAVLIVTVSLSPLPIGPSVGAAATVLILGAHGIAATAAGGVLLTVTGIFGALCFAGWACGDRALASLRNARGLRGAPVAAIAAIAPIGSPAAELNLLAPSS
jgi:uncharacterized membrane protein YbhN (UPF0104 family)